MKKRVITLMMAAALSVSACVGCSSNTAETTAAQTEAAAETTVAETETESTDYESGMPEVEVVAAVAPETLEDGETDLVELMKEGIEWHDENYDAMGIWNETDLNNLEEFYPGISDIEFKQLVVEQSYITGAPPEFVLAEVANADDVETLEEIFEQRVEDASADDPDYQENADAWKNNARITTKDNYVFLAVTFEKDEIPLRFILQ